MQVSSCSISDGQFPPSEVPAGCGQSLARRSQCQQGAQCPAMTTGASSLICCAQLQKTPAHTAIVRVIPPVASSVCLGHGAVSRAQGGSAWGAALLSLILWASHRAGLCCAALQIEPKALWLFPCLCQLVGAGYYYYCIIVLLSPPRHGTKGLPLMEKTLTPAFASLFPCGFSFPCICPVLHACALPGAASKAGSSVGMIQFPGQQGRD